MSGQMVVTWLMQWKAPSLSAAEEVEEEAASEEPQLVEEVRLTAAAAEERLVQTIPGAGAVAPGLLKAEEEEPAQLVLSVSAQAF